MTAAVIQVPEEITAGWLGEVLGEGELELLQTERIGTGQMSQSHRVRFRRPGGAEDSVIVKLASDDPTSRATGVGMGAYYREIAFYGNLAERIGGPLARCHLAVYDEAEGWFTLVLEDMRAATVGDQIAGASIEQARAAIRSLARLHGPVIGDLALGTADYLNQPNPLDQALLSQLLGPFLERYGERIAPGHAALCERFVASIDAWAADQRPPLGLVHGDYRLDNLLFDGDQCTAVDWQTLSWGPALVDVSYFIGGCLSVEDRRAHERELVALYHETLLEQGIEGLGLEQCWEEYRRSCFHGLLMTIAASMVVVRTERGDEMFMTWLARNAQQAIDLDAVSELPPPNTERLPALKPEAEDEGRHPPGPEGLWNESWYFDAVSDAGDLGLYVRLGRLPNQDVCLYTACVCGPGRPSIMLVDPAAPLPGAEDESQLIDTPTLRAEQRCLAPLERFRLTARGVAEAHADHSAPLRGESGEPLKIELDLLWETDGVPYSWRQSTRYEIPCRVTGTVRLGAEEIAFSGPGQRDHSWGARDWWAVDWMWSALHLEDGTHTHAVGVPQMPGYGVGYVQREGTLEEIDSVTATEQDAANGLPERAQILSGPPELTLELEPLAFGALRLEAPDGRLSLFPRAMCRARTADGRSGIGWVEWNRVQH
jgi:Phosphotransferase enzyme family